MSDQTLPLPQTPLKTRELIEFPPNDHSLNAPPAAESVASENDEINLNQSDIPKVPSKESKDVKGFQRLSKLFGRNRVSKNAEEISLDSSRTPDTRSALSNDSQMDYSGQRVSSRLLPNIGSHLKRLMRLKSSTREIKTEEEVIIVGVPKGSLAVPVPVLENDEIEVHPGNPDSNQIAESDLQRTSDSLESDPQKALISSEDLFYSNESENKKPNEIDENYQIVQNSTTSSHAVPSEIRSSTTVDYNIMVTPISSVIPETVTTPQQNLPNDINDESIVVTPVLVPVPVPVPVPVVVRNDFENDIPAVVVESPPPPSAAFHLITATLNAPTQLGPNQAEAGIQVSRRSAAAAVREDLRMPFLYLEEEARIEPYNQTILGGENDSITTGSESSDVTSEVADANEQREGRDAAEQYYNAQCSSGSTEGGVISGGGGMDCLPLRPGPFHYLISEQAKSLVALQELQNEVGALLEFRDLVIETFPNLRHKMAASASASSASVMSSTTNIPLPLTSPSSRRIAEWEPGRVRRRIPAREGEPSSSLPRSRSNSHSGGNKHSATVQDSGFSTETSSKDSASTAIPRPTSPRPILDEAEDELWNLLDVIHRRGTRLREEVECLQGRLESAAPEELGLSTDVLEAVKKVARPEEARAEEEEKVQILELRREREHLLDKVTELEAETISSRVRAQELQSELEALSALRNGLEDRLRAEIDSKTEIYAPGAQRIVPLSPPPISSPKSPGNIRSNVSAFALVVSNKSHKNRFRTRTIEKNVLANITQPIIGSKEGKTESENYSEAARARLGHLDSVLISPKDVRNVKNVDSKKIEAILNENSTLELQRHLITTTVHNQVLQERLNEADKTSGLLTERLDKTREENDDLRFQLEERNIELEGTRARVRVLERLQHRPPTEMDPTEGDIELPRGSDQGCLEPGSSTESARDHHQEIIPSPRRRPSRIPLPGSKQAAPKPPTHGRNNSRESLKSLTTRQPRDSSRDSLGGKSFSKTRDSSRESLNKSLPRNTSTPIGNGTLSNNNKEAGSKDSLNKSLPRHNNNSGKDSLNKSSSLSRAREPRDSLESSGIGGSPGTPPRRPPAPARRAHSLARPSVVESDTGKGFTDPPSSWCSTSGSFRHSESSMYPDSLNQETSSVTGSTRIEFILGSPTRRFRTNSAWPPRYFDSIDSAALIAESFSTDEFPLRRGEALAECDSLESHPISSDA